MGLNEEEKKNLNLLLKFCSDYQYFYKKFPSERLCPNCTSRVKITKGCPRMECPTCRTVFCMSCLKLGEHVEKEICEVQPRQQI
jgi:hypothetical protein